MKKRILFFTNLHPLPWQPTRATYNFEEIRHLKEHAEINVLIPVPWFTWLKQVVVNGHRSPEGFCLFPFFYIPKILSSLHPLFLMLSMLICIKPFVMLARSENVIASWAYAEAVVAAVGKKLFKYKLVIECLGSDVNVLMQKPLHRFQMKWAFDKATAVTTKSKALAKEVQKHMPHVLPTVVYNGVDFDVFTLRDSVPFSKNTQQFLFVGSLIPTKGVFELIDGFANAAKVNPQIRLRIAGEGSSKEALQKLVNAKSLSHLVSFLGAIPHRSLVTELHDADALILPSYREGVPNVIMEALATGTPVIATDVGGICEVVESQTNGILIEARNKNSVGDALRTITSMQWYPRTIKKSIAKYTWRNTAKEIIALILNKQR